MQRRNLILTCVARYRSAELRPFVDSWRRNVPDSDLVVFADHVAPETVAWLEATGVQVLPASLALVSMGRGPLRFVRHGALRLGMRLFRGWTAAWTQVDDGRLARVQEAMLDLSGARFAYYLRFLELRRARYDAVALVDCRDLIFQSSPFPATDLHVFAENETIGESHFARRWFELTFGHAIWRELARQPFLCSGVTIGGIDPVCDYVAHMARLCAEVMAVTGEDQVVHNFLIHRGLLPAQIHPFGGGVAVNLNRIRLSQLNFADGRLMTPANQPYPIVHQYDRVQGLRLREVEPSSP